MNQPPAPKPLLDDNRRLGVLIPLLVAILLPGAQLLPAGGLRGACQGATVLVLLALVYRMGRNERASRRR